MVVCEEGVCNAQNSISFWRDIRFRARVNWVSFGEVCVGMWATGSVGNVSSTGVLFKLEEGIYGLAMMFFVRYCFHLNLLGGMYMYAGWVWRKNFYEIRCTECICNFYAGIKGAA